MPIRKPDTEEEAEQEPLRGWEIAKLRRIIERSERIAWAWGVIKAGAAGAGLILGTWVLFKEQIVAWLSRGGGASP